MGRSHGGSDLPTRDGRGTNRILNNSKRHHGPPLEQCTSSCAKTRPIGLRGLAVVELEHAAEPRTARDRACADRPWLGRDELVAQTLVRPLLVIMLDERSYGGPEVPFAEGHNPRQALGLGGPHKPLGKRVQIWTP